jgi:hypothetical protein
MVTMSKIILPYELGYVGNKEADKRRKETKERLRQREREFAERQQPPLIVPERLRTASVGGLVTIEVSNLPVLLKHLLELSKTFDVQIG